jgi:hypothetical protein
MNHLVNLYKNGVLGATRNMIFEKSGTVNLDIGRSASTYNAFSLKSLFFHNKVLTLEEHQDIHNAGEDAYCTVSDGLSLQLTSKDFAGTALVPTTIYDTKNVRVLQSGTLEDDTIYKSLVTLANGQQSLYVDNILVDSGTESFTELKSGSEKYIIGAGNITVSKPIVINRVLTEAQRTALLNGTDTTLLQPLQRLGAARFNGSNTVTTSGVSESGIRCVVFFIETKNASEGIFTLATGKTISVSVGGSITTSGFTNATIEEEDLGSHYFVYVQFDEETMTDPIMGTGSTAVVDELLVFDTPLTTQDKTDIKSNVFYNNHSKWANCKLWWSFDNPLLGDRITDGVLQQSLSGK